MALTAHTKTPKKLLREIRNAIDVGTIVRWQSTNNSFTYTGPPDWLKRKAWFKPTVLEREAIKFNIIRPEGKNVTKDIYAIYHGRFVTMLLSHFDSLIDSISLTALADDDDVV